jgi:DNA-binding NarL/FixJ family response regulator
MRCLIVDDDASPRELMARMLGGAGHRVTAAADLEGAREALLTGGIDVVLLDLELPGVRGADAIAAVRALSPSSRVLVVSGHDDPRRVLGAIDAGADGYLLKDELGEALAGALQAVRAGHAPLSPRVAALVLRRMRRQGSQPPAAAVGRLKVPPKVV